MYPDKRKEKLLLFHGTTSDNVESIKTKIDIGICKKISDFGQGFYLTDNYEQAKVWAKKMALIKNRNSKGIQVEASIIAYEINLYKITQMNNMEYNDKNTKWAKFIFNCRTLNLHQYDVVYGPVADGSISNGTAISNLVRQYQNKEINFKDFHTKISAGFPWPEKNQISFHSERATSFLNFKQHWEVQE